MTTMRDIDLAKDLVIKTFGINTVDVSLRRFMVEDTKVQVILKYAKLKVTFDIKEKFVVSKFDGEYTTDIQSELSEKAEYIRKELFEDAEDDDQLSIDDLESDTEQVTAEGTNTLEAKTSDDTVEELSNNDVFEEVEK